MAVGMHEQMKLMDSPRPSSISSAEAGMVSSSSMQVRVTFSAPSRRAVRPASKATSPPPMTTTFLPIVDRLLQGGVAQQVDGGEDALGVVARDGQRLAALQAGGQVDGLVAVVHEAVDGEIRAGRLAAVELDAQRRMRSMSCCSAALGRRYSGMPKRSMPPARPCSRRPDLVAQQGQVAGGGEAAGPGADDGDLLVERDGAASGTGTFSTAQSADEPLEAGDGDGFVNLATGAVCLALVGADAAADGGEGVGVAGYAIRLGEAAVADEGHVALRAGVHGAGALAGEWPFLVMAYVLGMACG